MMCVWRKNESVMVVASGHCLENAVAHVGISNHWCNRCYTTGLVGERVKNFLTKNNLKPVKSMTDESIFDRIVQQ